MTRIRSQIHLRRPIAQVYDYVTTPTRWREWHPSSVGVHGIADRPAVPGDRMTEEVHAAGRSATFQWEVTLGERPQRWTVAGRFYGGTASIAYEFTPTADGVLFTRELSYELTDTVLRVLNWFVLARRLRHESAAALERLRQRIEGAPGPSASAEAAA